MLSFPPIPDGDSPLQYAGDGDPNEVRNLCQRQPFGMRLYSCHAPENGSPNDHDVDRCQGKISHSELNRSEY